MTLQAIDSAVSTRPPSLSDKKHDDVTITETASARDSDEKLLAEIGYKQVRKNPTITRLAFPAPCYIAQ